jgi:hypothetical protein
MWRQSNPASDDSRAGEDRFFTGANLSSMQNQMQDFYEQYHWQQNIKTWINSYDPETKVQL